MSESVLFAGDVGDEVRCSLPNSDRLVEGEVVKLTLNHIHVKIAAGDTRLFYYDEVMRLSA